MTTNPPRHDLCKRTRVLRRLPATIGPLLNPARGGEKTMGRPGCKSLPSTPAGWVPPGTQPRLAGRARGRDGGLGGGRARAGEAAGRRDQAVGLRRAGRRGRRARALAGSAIPDRRPERRESGDHGAIRRARIILRWMAGSGFCCANWLVMACCLLVDTVLGYCLMSLVYRRRLKKEPRIMRFS